MSKDLLKVFPDGLTKVYTAAQLATAGLAAGMRQFVGGVQYQLLRAEGAVAAAAACKVDTTDTTGASVAETSALDSDFVGVAMAALADEEYGWIALEGMLVAVKVANGTAIGNKLRVSGTAGVLEPFDDTVGVGLAVAIAIEANTSGSAAATDVRLLPRPARTRHVERISVPISSFGTLADGTTYDSMINIGRAGIVTKIGISAQTAPIGGTSTVNVYKNAPTTTAMLAANYDPTGLTAATIAAPALHGTAANITFDNDDTIVVRWVTGTQTTDAVGCAVVVEYIVTDLG